MAPDTRLDRTVLVALDGSLCSRVSAELALQVAGGCGLGVRGLFVVDECIVLDVYADYRAEVGERGRSRSRSDLPARYRTLGVKASAWLEEQCRRAGVAASTEVLFGGIRELVLRESKGCAMLALGRRGRRHEGEPRHVGRNFHAVVPRTTMPVLVGGEGDRRIRRQLLAYDGRKASEEAIAWTARIQRALGTDVIVTLAEEGDAPGGRPAATADLEGLLGEAGLLEYRVVKHAGRPAASIVAAAAETGADVVVMGGYRHRGVLRWITGDPLDEVLRTTDLPVLVA